MLVTAFLMGLVGSTHCAGMCGPLILASPVVGTTPSSILASRFVYNGGRIATYVLLGALFGILGKSLLLAGLQQGLSISVGVAMLLFLILGHRGFQNPAGKSAFWVKSLFRRYFQARTFHGVFMLGAANGLLPCGLVYMAGTAATAMGDLPKAALYMLLFGLGTLPMMLGLAFSKSAFPKLIPYFRIKGVVPITVAVVALTLILRGLGLGIPYVSPTITEGDVRCSACVPVEAQQ